MIAPYAMLVVGLLLVYMEFFLPGGIMGTCGAVLLISGIVFFALHAGNALHIFFFALASFLGTAAVIQLALKRLKSSDQESSVYLSADQEGFRAPVFDQNMIGKVGSVLTDLKPSGHVLIEGSRLQAVSKMAYIEKGSSVVVVGGKGAYLIVKLQTQQEGV